MSLVNPFWPVLQPEILRPLSPSQLSELHDSCIQAWPCKTVGRAKLSNRLSVGIVTCIHAGKNHCRKWEYRFLNGGTCLGYLARNLKRKGLNGWKPGSLGQRHVDKHWEVGKKCYFLSHTLIPPRKALLRKRHRTPCRQDCCCSLALIICHCRNGTRMEENYRRAQQRRLPLHRSGCSWSCLSLNVQPVYVENNAEPRYGPVP